MKCMVIGCGRWGSFIAWYLNYIGQDVTLYGRKNSSNMKGFLECRKNDLLSLPSSIGLSSDLSLVSDVDVIFISINAQNIAKLIAEINQYDCSNKTIVLCMKGIEIDQQRRLSQIIINEQKGDNKVAVWIGPGHVQDYIKGIPNCMVIDSDDRDVKNYLVKNLSSELIRFYYGNDMIGNELGAAAKNVYGIAAGMLDALQMTPLKGPLIARAPRELAILIDKMGGNGMSAYGLCHLGDYQATIFSKYSHNRMFGENFVKGIPYDKLAEGYYTVKAIRQLAMKHHIHMPITNAIYDILYESKDAKDTLKQLFERSLKEEFGNSKIVNCTSD